MDETYARGTAFGGHVVPGTMISSLAVGLGSLDVPIPASAGMVGMSWRFLLPVRPGDSLETRWRLNRKRAVQNPAVGLCFWSIDVLNHRGEIVATGEVGRLVQRRQHQGRATESSPAGTGVGAPPAEPEGAPSANGDAPEVSEPVARRRRRRGGRGAGGAGPAAESPAAPAPAPGIPPLADLPEPAPADTPSPGRRRRRRGGRGSGSGGSSAPSPTELAPPPPPVELGSPAPARIPAAEGGLRGVFRRLRGS